MATTEQIKEFVVTQLISGEEIHYVSPVPNPRIAWFSTGLRSLILAVISVAICTMAPMVPGTIWKAPAEEKTLVASVAAGVFLVAFALFHILFYKKSTRRIVVTTNLRFVIFEYLSELHRINADNLDRFENRKEITYDDIEEMVVNPRKNKSGMLALTFREENERRNGYVTSKLHLEVDDCDAIKNAVPARIRPDSTKDDFWERTYRD